jgi:hypothetical protein
MPVLFIVTLFFVFDMYVFSKFIPGNWLEKVISPFVTVTDDSYRVAISLAFINVFKNK